MSAEQLNEDEVPDQHIDQASKPPIHDPSEVLGDGTPAPVVNDNGAGVQQVVTLLKLHPFLDLFFFAAGRRYPRSKSLRSRVDLQKSDHKVWFAFCVILDMLFIALLSLLLLSIVAVTAWKTLIGDLPWGD